MFEVLPISWTENQKPTTGEHFYAFKGLINRVPTGTTGCAIRIRGASLHRQITSA